MGWIPQNSWSFDPVINLAAITAYNSQPFNSHTLTAHNSRSLNSHTLLVTKLR